MAVEAFERAAVDRDLVRERSAVVAGPPRERDALVQAEQRLSRRRLVFQHDLDVGDPAAKLRRERIESVLDQLFEVGSRVVGGFVRLDYRLRKNHLTRRICSSLWNSITCPARSSSSAWPSPVCPCRLLPLAPSASWSPLQPPGGRWGQPTDATPAAGGVRKCVALSRR